MKLRPTPSPACAVKRARAAFTLAEVLAALVFMAIVIPVAVEGLRVASRAGVLATRKAVALRFAEQVLHEQIVTGDWVSSGRGGSLFDGPFEYRWMVQSDSWERNGLRLLTAVVTFGVQNQDYDVRLSTLVDTPTTTTSTNSTSATTGTTR